MDSKMKTDAKDKKFIEFPGLIHQRSSSFADYLAGIVDKTVSLKASHLL